MALAGEQVIDADEADLDKLRALLPLYLIGVSHAKRQGVAGDEKSRIEGKLQKVKEEETELLDIQADASEQIVSLLEKPELMTYLLRDPETGPELMALLDAIESGCYADLAGAPGRLPDPQHVSGEGSASP